MSIRICKSCNLVTDKRTCMVCGKHTMKTSKKELTFNGKPSSKIKRHPREIDKSMAAQEATIHMIEAKCAEFDCLGQVTGVKVGPVVTQFDFVPSSHIRVKRVRAMHEDLAMALGRDNVTITRIPGQSAVAIMVPNPDRKEMKFDGTIDGFLKHRKTMDLPLNLGVDSLGNPVVIDLAALPHLLVAGETGSGKSVLLATIILSLLYARSPKQLQFMLIDSKMVELKSYQDLPHCKTPVATTIHEALQLLERAEQEMRRRMTLIDMKGCKNLKQLNEKLEPMERLPYIVIVIDELADLILQDKKAFTSQLAIIAGMARAAGVHIIAATQRPSVDVLSGKIKVNFPARIAFHMPSAGDSKTVLTTKGAEQLSAKGDAFAILPGRMGLTRIHTPHTQDPDVKKMMRASIVVGHTLRVPADISPKEMAQLEKDLAAAAKAKAKADNTSIADAMEKEDGPTLLGFSDLDKAVKKSIQ